MNEWVDTVDGPRCPEWWWSEDTTYHECIEVFRHPGPHVCSCDAELRVIDEPASTEERA